VLIKFFKNGKGGGAGPVGYLTAREVVAYSGNRDILRDEHGAAVMLTRDPLPEVHRGSPERTGALIDATAHKWTYRSGVLSFTTEDAPTGRQQIQAMDAFEELAFAGLEPDQRDILWVRHTHEGRVELHFVTPRMELASGKSLNIAPPGYQHAFDALRDVLNKEHGWADPQDPERARDVTSVIEAARRGEAREVIHDWLLDRIADGTVQDRRSMVGALEAAGFEIPRAGKNYITALDPESGDRFRLKGDIFRENWTRAATLERAARGDAGGDRNPSPARGSQDEGSRRLDGLDIGDLQSRLREFIEGRAEYNRGRYGRAAPIEPARDHPKLGPDQGRPESNPASDAVRALGARNLADHDDRDDLRRQLVLGQVADQRSPRQLADANRDFRESDESGAGFELGYRETQAQRVPVRLQARSLSDTGRGELSHEPPSTRDDGPKTGRHAIDRLGARITQLRRAVNDSLGNLGGAIHRAGEALNRHDHGEAERARSLREIADRVSDLIDRSVERVRQHVAWLRERATSFAREHDSASSSRAGIAPATGVEAASKAPETVETQPGRTRDHTAGPSR